MAEKDETDPKDSTGRDSGGSGDREQGHEGSAGRVMPPRRPVKLPGLPEILPHQLADMLPHQLAELLPHQLAELLPHQLADMLPHQLADMLPHLPGLPFKLPRGASPAGVTGPGEAAGDLPAEQGLPEQPGLPPSAVLGELHTSAADLEALILGATRKYTAPEVIEPEGITRDEARRFWRALGFANVGEARALTDIDARVLHRVLDLIRSDQLEEDLAIKAARAVGQTMARLAEWQVNTLLEHIEATGATGATQTALAYNVVEQLMPDLEHLLVYTWRRHLAAAAARLTQLGEEDDMVRSRLAVGFADLVGFTRLSRRLEEDDLGRLVETFEARASDLITSLGGRVVKMLGDEVMFVADSPEAAAEIGLQLIETMASDETIPELRVGMAVGTVVTRMGDVYGTTVNMASRLTSLAPRNTVVIDPEMAHALGENSQYQVGTMWRRPVRGFGLVAPAVLMRRPLRRT